MFTGNLKIEFTSTPFFDDGKVEPGAFGGDARGKPCRARPHDDHVANLH
jgi:hypothetical protein